MLARALRLRPRPRLGLTAPPLAMTPQCLPLIRQPPAAAAALPRRRPLYQSTRQSLRDEVPKGWTRNKTMAVIAFLLASSGIAIALWSYTTYLHAATQTLHTFPPPVAAELRRALYHNLRDQPARAITHFRAALERAAALGMDPLSPEVTGIHLQLAALLEQRGLPAKAAAVLEHVHGAVAGGAEARPRGRERTALLARAVAVALKLGELRGGMGRQEEAEEALVWAVTTLVGERRRREEQAAAAEGGGRGEEAVDEGEWVGDGETAMALENLAAHYVARGEHGLAAPLFVEALALLPKGDCHAVILMNNLSVSLSQQPLPPSAPTTRAQLIAASSIPWARKALRLAREIAPPARTAECDAGCAAAAYNLGEFAYLLGDRDEARRRYGEAAAVARAAGLAEGVVRAEGAVRALEAEEGAGV